MHSKSLEDMWSRTMVPSKWGLLITVVKKGELSQRSLPDRIYDACRPDWSFPTTTLTFSSTGSPIRKCL